MRKVVAIAIALGGCKPAVIPLDAGVGDPSPTVASVFWTLQTSAGVVQPCPAGFDTAAVTYFEAAANAAPLASFPCSAGRGLVTLPYNSKFGIGTPMVRIENATTNDVFGESDALAGGEPPAIWRVTIITDIGNLRLHWTVSQSGSPSTCAAVGNPPVTLQVVPSAGSAWTATAERDGAHGPTAARRAEHRSRVLARASHAPPERGTAAARRMLPP